MHFHTSCGVADCTTCGAGKYIKTTCGFSSDTECEDCPTCAVGKERLNNDYIYVITFTCATAKNAHVLKAFLALKQTQQIVSAKK